MYNGKFEALVARNYKLIDNILGYAKKNKKRTISARYVVQEPILSGSAGLPGGPRAQPGFFLAAG